MMRVYPHWLDEMRVMAKSADMGGQTLVQHTLEVIERLVDMRRLHPAWGDNRFWARMFWGCLLHDFGKAARGFQDVLNGVKGQWSTDKHRHEIVSLAFVDWLFPKKHPDREAVIAVIIAHHKDAERIDFMYGGAKQKKDVLDDIRALYDERYAFLADQISGEVKIGLWRWLAECGKAWADELGFWGVSPTLMPLDEALAQPFADAIYKALRDFFRWRDTLPATDKHHTLLYRGAILTSDHSASAGVGKFPDPLLNTDHAMKPFNRLSQKLNQAPHDLMRSHQWEMQHVPLGHTILIAPTGSGKTEAAILWATAQMRHKPASRLFYTLPYQASMNAMANRLWQDYFAPPAPDDQKIPFTDDSNSQVTIQHSRSVLKFYQDAMDGDEKDSDEVKNKKAKTSSDRARHIKNRAQLNYYPIQVFSPYQMLKAAYALKGYEALLLDYADALFIFDEIHAYDPKRLALIITYMGYLAKHFRARFLIMTATLPPLIQHALQTALGEVHQVRADQAVFDASKRHTVRFIDGDISSQMERIIALYKEEKAVLVVCNQVQTAQMMYDQFKGRGFAPLTESGGDVMLLHGRFNGQDRRDKEQLLMQLCGVGAKKRRRVIVIATQVVEVSLNVDFDTLFTEPAPLEAMLQRFGRVNRGRKAQILCDVHIMTTPYDGNYKPYDEPMVMQSVAVLRAEYDGQPIDEAQVDAMLAHIYAGAIAEQWQTEYQNAQVEFEKCALGVVKPFESADIGIMQEFYKLFDGTQVLPVASENDYADAIEKRLFIEANQYLVNVTNGQYHQLRGHGLLTQIPEGEFFAHVRVPYDAEYGLRLHEAVEKAKNPSEDSLEDEDA
jgi:CRISPR-associated endonuclease/helicase Cas3